MAIRLSGMVSGLDTDAMIDELVSAYSKKKDNIYKEQQWITYQQDAWKALNTKVYSFYSKSLSNMRFSSAYAKKAVTISDSTKAVVSGSSSAVNGTQKLRIESLAKSGYLTGAELDGTVKGDTKLSELGITDGTINISVDGKSKDIELNGDMSVNQFVAKLKEAGVAANFDEKNQRFFVSSLTSGEAADFSLTSTDDAGASALMTLGLSEEAEGAVRIKGEDAVIYLNDAKFKSNTNSFSINGLNITATAETGDQEVSITTATDVQGIYDSIKGFIYEYNELIKEMESLVNADSKGEYEPLTDEEMEEMTEKQIEKWEDKLKEAALSGDDTLKSVISSMKMAMATGVEVNGKTLSLASFGIKTSGYFLSGENEKGVYHIDGDSEDGTSSGNADKLMSAIATDPDTTIEFFTKLATELYNKLTAKMSASSISSAYTLYNDKHMKSQYDRYEDKLDDWEERIEEMREKYVKQFSAMESALSSLTSQQSSLASLLGTNY